MDSLYQTTSENIYLIRQQINATNQFNGAIPTDSKRKKVGSTVDYTDLSEGGGFYFGNMRKNKIRRITLDLADATSWSLDLIVDEPDDTTSTLNLYSDADFSQTDLIIIDDQNIILPNEKIKLTTSGATQEMYAQILIDEW